jgi:hypothetical protein
MGTASLNRADYRHPTCIYAKRTVLGKARVIRNTACIPHVIGLDERLVV